MSKAGNEGTQSVVHVVGLALFVSAIVMSFFFLPTPSVTHSTAAVSALPSETPPSAFDSLRLQAEAAIVYDLSTHEVLFAKNADAQLPLASLTKLLTIYSALAVLSPDTIVTIPAAATRVDPPRALNEDQQFTLQDLARLTLVASLNDGALAIATAAADRLTMAPSEMLSRTAEDLGLVQTYAINGSGLDTNATISGAYGSAHDVALLAAALVAQSPSIASATAEPYADATSLGGTRYHLKNTDPVVENLPRLLLSKTGYTDLAGGNLVLVFDASIDHPIAVVVLGSSREARFTDGQALVDAALAHFAAVSLP